MSRVMAVFVLVSVAVPLRLQANDKKSISSSVDEPRQFTKSKQVAELMLVRAWNPNTGELVGWMPVHCLAITLQRVGGDAINFDSNESVQLYLPHRPYSPPRDDAVSLGPDAITLNGRQWVPLEHDHNINIVRIRKACFYIKAIVFDEAKWRMPLTAAGPERAPE